MSRDFDRGRHLGRGCRGSIDLARFVDGELPGDEAAAMEAHLPGCAHCRAVVCDLRALVVDLAVDPVSTLGGFGEQVPDLAPLVLARAALPPPRRTLIRPLAAALSVAAALCAGIAIERQRASMVGEAGFQARGGGTSSEPSAEQSADRWVALHVWSVRDGRGGVAGAPVPLADGASIRACDTRLLFAYDNGGPHPYHHLAIVGADPNGRAEWFFPDGGGPEGTIAAQPGSARELREEVGLDGAAIAHGRLRLWAVFSDVPIHRERVVLAVNAAGPAATRLPLPGTGQHRLELFVEDCAAR